ncbi:MAG TPA: hypothetical protein VN660_01045 [Steroidobacteraceae bacterium]|nr:hypothetical protein [Steroidobacteraceae bacterium]
MSAVPDVALQDLERRIEALERSRLAPSEFAAYNAAKIAQAVRLQEAIAKVLAVASQPYRLTAKHVIRELDLTALGCPKLALRTVRKHMAALRGTTRA